jgi:ribosomal protein S16
MFQQYKQVSNEYEKGELFKATLLARAQRILVCTSTILMSLAFVQYLITSWTLSWVLIGQLLLAIVPTTCIAVVVEIGLILGAASVRRDTHDWLSWATLIMGTLFSITGGELFFGKLAEHQPIEIHIAFALIGLFVPILQITFELNKQHIQDFIKEGADISNVRNHILEKQTESMIVETRFNARSASIKKQEVKTQIEAHSDRTVVDLVSNQEGHETIIAEVETITQEDLIQKAVEILRQERDQDRDQEIQTLEQQLMKYKNTVQELLQERAQQPRLLQEPHPRMLGVQDQPKNILEDQDRHQEHDLETKNTQEQEQII